MGWATGLVKSQKYMGGKPNNQRPSTKPAAQPFNLKPDFFQYNLYLYNLYPYTLYLKPRCNNLPRAKYIMYKKNLYEKDRIINNHTKR